MKNPASYFNMQYLDPREDDILSKYERKLEINSVSKFKKLRKGNKITVDRMSQPVENLPDVEECDVLTKYEREQETISLNERSKSSNKMKLEITTLHSRKLRKSIIKNIENQKSQPVENLLDVEEECDVLTKYEKEQETIFQNELAKYSKPTPELSCVYCEKLFSSEEGLSLHYRVLHKVYRCVKCSQNFSQRDYKIHNLVHKNSKPYSCLQCKKSFTKKCMLERHTNRHQGVASLVCCLCNVGFQTRQELQQHAQRKHKDVDLEEGKDFVRGNFQRCDVCKKYFRILAEFERHYLSHMNTVKHVCPICKCEFSCKENLVKHKDIEHKSGSAQTGFVALKSGKLFFCNVCHLGFVEKEYLEMHMWTHPPESVHACEECPETFRTDSELQTHYLEHVAEHYMIYDVIKKSNEMSMDKTTNSGDKIETLNIRVEVDEKGPPLSTNKSKNIFPQMNCEETSCVTAPQIFTLDFCNKALLNASNTAETMTCSNENNILQTVYTNKTNIQKYEKTVDSQLKANKLLKEKSDSSKPLVMDPLKIQVPTEFQSDASSRGIYLSTESNNHKFYEFLEKKYNLDSAKCTQKAAEFSQKEGAVLYKAKGDSPIEVQLGNNALAYQCDVCKKLCSSKDSLRVHKKRKHTNIPYNCSWCDKCYNRKDLLIAHERNNHNQIKPYSCHFCKKEFALHRSLRLHLFMHTREMPFRCEVCGKGFIERTNLDVHLVGHEKDVDDSNGKEILLGNVASQIPFENGVSVVGIGKDLKCRYCDKPFNKKTALKKHTLTHYKSSRVNFQCELCKIYFRSFDLLATHITRHANEQIVVCDLCKLGFASRALLLQHKNSEH